MSEDYLNWMYKTMSSTAAGLTATHSLLDLVPQVTWAQTYHAALWEVLACHGHAGTLGLVLCGQPCLWLLTKLDFWIKKEKKNQCDVLKQILDFTFLFWSCQPIWQNMFLEGWFCKPWLLVLDVFNSMHVVSVVWRNVEVIPVFVFVGFV